MHIRKEGQPYLCKDMREADICYLEDLLDNNGLLDYVQVCNKYPGRYNFMDYYALILNIPQEWKGVIQNNNYGVDLELHRLDLLKKGNQPSKTIYWSLMSRK